MNKAHEAYLLGAITIALRHLDNTARLEHVYFDDDPSTMCIRVQGTVFTITVQAGADE